MPFADDDPPSVYVVDEAPLMTGEDLADAQAAFDQRTNEPVVELPLTTGGARKFGDVTQKNVGRLFAIVLDDKVISAPVIREPILGGSGQISGNFTVETAQRPRDPAARRLAARQADDRRGAHRRPEPRRGLDPRRHHRLDRRDRRRSPSS